MKIPNSFFLNLSKWGAGHINLTNKTPNKNNPPSQRLAVIIMAIVDKGSGNGAGAK